jgi:hypothetical protein
MQIAEVELLAVPQGCGTNAIDTLILASPRIRRFFLVLSPPSTSSRRGHGMCSGSKMVHQLLVLRAEDYQAPAATAGDDGARFKAVVCSPAGTQISTEVVLSIFAPSAIESIGASFEGDGANGTPTANPSRGHHRLSIVRLTGTICPTPRRAGVPW